MKIAVIGTGYVGLVSGACFAEFGSEVVCVDKDRSKIDALKNGEIPIFEPGLDDLVERNVGANRLSFTTEIKEAIEGAEAVFIAVGTPSRRGDGHADLTYVFEAAKEIALHLKDYAVVVMKSTVPVGTCRKVEELIRATNPKAKFDICSNPEFLREGAAINDFMRPDRVVIGVRTKEAEDLMKRLYRPLYLLETPMVVTTPESSELTKYASNAFLATKISFINEMADLCEKTGADVQDVARGMGLDGRIGKKFLHAGPGFGGSCFPKDCRALSQIGYEYDLDLKIVNSVLSINDERKEKMATRICQASGGNVKGKKIAILGITFKPNTDDMRESPSLDIIPALQKAGAQVRATDPVGISEAKPLFSQDVIWFEDPYEAAKGADIVVILTEWNEYRFLDLDRLKEVMTHPCVVDLRNIYKPQEMVEKGFFYHSIGRASVAPAPHIELVQKI